jgi:hypothetical protein
MPTYNIKITINKLITIKLKNGNVEFKKTQAKDIKILTKLWHANIFANKRITKLIALAT